MLENILDTLPIAAKVKDVDNDMRYTFINKKAEELFEYPAKEAIGRTDFDIMPEAATMIRKEDEELVRTGIAQFGTRRFFTNRNGLLSRIIILFHFPTDVSGFSIQLGILQTRKFWNANCVWLRKRLKSPIV